MLLRKKQSEQAKKGIKPSGGNIFGIADYLVGQGKPLHLMLGVEEDVFQEQRKAELEPQLRRYGDILDNYPFSHIISLRLNNIESVQRIVDDYNAGKLDGIVDMELSTMDAVMCSGLGLGYR